LVAGGSGAVNIANSAFTAATGGGAGVNITPYGSASSQTPSVTIINSQFSGNTSTANGAGISVASINSSQTVTTNFTLVNDTISGNTCSTASYGCAISFNHGGGAATQLNYNLTMVNDTISNNSYTSGTAYAAGIYSRYTNTAFLNTVIEGNSVVALTSGDSSDLWTGSGNNAVVSTGSVINSTANTSTTVAQIGLSDLGSFGGPTQTMVPVPISSSPLLKAASSIAAGQVTEASITAGGSGISGTPTLTFTNGNCTGSPAATATVTSGVLTGIKLTSTGTGCTGTTTDATGTWFSIGGLSSGATARAYILNVPKTDARGITYPTSGTNTVDVGAVQTNPSLVFSQQPQANVATSGTFSPAPAVEYYDFGNPVALTNTSYTGSNTAQISMSAASGTLGGTTSVYLSNASPAIATFSALTAPSSALTGDSLSATTASGTHFSALTASSSSFNVYGAATQLAFSTQPSPTITAGGASGSFQVYVEDANGSLVTSSSASVTLTVTCPACSPSYTPFSATVSASGGVATFSGSNLPTPTIAGAYSYALTNSASLNNPSAAAETVKAAAATHLTLTGFPSSAANESAYTATVTAYDSNGNIATSYAGTVSFTSSDPNFVQPASYTYVSADAGAHGFSVALYTAGTQSLTATDGTLSITQSGIAVGSILWVLNNNGSLSKLNATGSIFSGNGGDCPVSSSGSGSAAMDSNANVWMVSTGANNLVECSPNGTSSSTFSGGGLNAPVAVQVDGNGQIWVVNGGSGANSLSLFSIAGAAISGGSGITGFIAGQSALHSPKGMAVDSAGALWVTNGNNTVTQVIGAGAPVTVPTVNAVSNNTLGVKP
jgi:hypothetical protein